MQEIIAFLIDTIQDFVSTCLSNELLSWGIYLFVIAAIGFVISTIWKR